MKLSLVRQDLRWALKLLGPLGKYVLLSADEKAGELTISGSNEAMTLHLKVPAEVSVKGKVGVCASILSAWLAAEPAALMEIELSEKKALIFSCSSQLSLSSLPEDEFSFPAGKFKAGLSLDGGALSTAMARTRHAVSTDNTRAALTGLYLKTNEGFLDIVGTDTHRVAYTKIKFDQEFKALIPGVAVMYLTHLLKEEGVEISQSESLTRFTQDQYELIANNIKQPYANYQNVFPKEVLTYWQFNLEELRSAVKSAKVVASENNGRIMLADTLISKEGEEPKSGVLIYARSETSEFRKTISLVKSKGISQKLAINAKYLLDALEQIGGAEGVVFGINEALKPIILRSSQKEDPYRELIMPMVLENSSRPPEDQEEEKKEEGAVDGADIRTALKKCQE